MEKINRGFLLFFFCTCFMFRAQSQSWSWAASCTGPSNDHCSGIATDAAGNSFITGFFYSNTISFGSFILTNADTSGITPDVYIVKYDNAGNVLWAKSGSGTGESKAMDIFTDAAGNSYISGFFRNSPITFDTTTLISAGNADIFIAKYDPAGNVLWVKKYGGSNYDICYSVWVDGTGNLYMTGGFGSSITFGSITLTASGQYMEIFVTKSDASGNILWAKKAGGASADWGTGVSTDLNGNVLVMGVYLSFSATFGSTTLVNADSTSYSPEVFLIKYDASGNMLWATCGSGNYEDLSTGMSVDANGNTYIVGHFLGIYLTFGSYTLSNNIANDIFIVKYDPSGNVLWAKNPGGNGGDYGTGIILDANGNAYITGFSSSHILSFDTITLYNTTQTGNGNDLFIAKYDGSGNAIWAISHGDSSNISSFGISQDPNGNFFLAGTFDDPSIAFDGVTLVNSGDLDVFIAKLNSITGIEQNNTPGSSIVISYPATDQIMVESSDNIIQVTVINIAGQVIYADNPNSKNISLQSKNNGIFFISLITARGTINRKIVVNN